MKEQDKITGRDLSEMEISNIYDKEFKVMIVKILTGLDKRLERITETLNEDMSKN